MRCSRDFEREGRICARVKRRLHGPYERAWVRVSTCVSNRERLLTVGMSQCICARVICSNGFMCVLMGLCGFLYVRIWVSLYWRCRDEEGAFEDSLVVYTLMHVVCTCARRLLPGEDGCGIRARVLVYACVSREETPSSAKFPSPFRPKMKL